MFLPVALDGPCRCRAGRESAPQAEMRQAQGKGRLKTAARRQCRRTRLLFSLPCAFPTLPCGRYAPVRAVLFLPQHAKSSLKRELFSCAAASGRSARNKSRAGGVAGIFAVARRPPSVRYHDRVVVAHPPITRAGDGMEGRGAMALLPRRQRPHGRRSHSRRDEGSCGQRRQQRKLPLLSGYAAQSVSFRRATMPRRASSATTFSAKTGSMASASGERPTCMVRQSKG